jgi:hypothetical protein
MVPTLQTARSVLDGHGHRPQDHPEANAVIRAFHASL